jgi:hypothetical protein
MSAGEAIIGNLLALPAATIAKLASGSCPLRFGTIEMAHSALVRELGPYYLTAPAKEVTR